MAAKKPTKQLQECTPVHPNIPILGGIEQGMCNAFKGAGMTPGTEPNFLKNIPMIGPSLSQAGQAINQADTLSKPNMFPIVAAGIIILLVLILRR